MLGAPEEGEVGGDGVRLLLGGEGGGEVFAGYGQEEACYVATVRYWVWLAVFYLIF